MTWPTCTVSPAAARISGDDARARRGQLHVDLVGRQLDDRLAVGDLVADRDRPFEDRALRHRLAAGRRDDVDDLRRHVRRQLADRLVGRGRAGAALRVVLGVGAVLGRGGRVRARRRRRRAAISGDGAGAPPPPLAPPCADAPLAISASTSPTAIVSPAAATIFVSVPDARSGHLGVDLVGRHLDDRLALGDRVALLLVPLEHGSLADRFAHRGKRHQGRRVHGHPAIHSRDLSPRPWRVASRVAGSTIAAASCRPASIDIVLDQHSGTLRAAPDREAATDAADVRPAPGDRGAPARGLPAGDPGPRSSSPRTLDDDRDPRARGAGLPRRRSSPGSTASIARGPARHPRRRRPGRPGTGGRAGLDRGAASRAGDVGRARPARSSSRA